ncbi:putative transcription factor WRKY family [Dioscorea sansibarensis]
MHEITEGSVLYQELAIQEITRGYKLAARLQTFIPKGEPQLELVGVLLEEVLQALSMALSMLKKSSNTCTQAQTSSEQIISETSSASFSDQGSTEAPEEVKIPASTSIVCGKRQRQQRLKTMDSWTKVTYAPHDDGHQWRKYGQKNIQKFKLEGLSYYRCTYKDEGCQATKHVQQKDKNDPPLFLVTYYEQHNCKTNNNPMIITPQITQDPLLPVEPNLFSFESNANMLFCNQEKAMFRVSTTDQQNSDQERGDLQNMIIDQTARGSVVNSEQCLEAIPNSSVEDFSLSACMSPPWEAMIMDYLKMDSFGLPPLHEGFSSF